MLFQGRPHTKTEIEFCRPHTKPAPFFTPRAKLLIFLRSSSLIFSSLQEFTCFRKSPTYWRKKTELCDERKNESFEKEQMRGACLVDAMLD